MIMDRTRPATLGGTTRLGLRAAGAGLLAATGGIRLDLYLTGYRSIPTIGWLFLLQVIAAFGLAAVVLVSGRRLAAAAGAGFALTALGGYLLSVWIGLFGFKEVRTTAGIVAGLIEVAAFAVLAVPAAVPAPGPAAGAQPQPGSLAAKAAGERAWCRADGGGPVRGRPGPAGNRGGRGRRGGTSEHRRRRADRAHRAGRRGHGPGQLQGPHPVLVRAEHRHQVGLQRVLRPRTSRR